MNRADLEQRLGKYPPPPGEACSQYSSPSASCRVPHCRSLLLNTPSLQQDCKWHDGFQWLPLVSRKDVEPKHAITLQDILPILAWRQLGLSWKLGQTLPAGSRLASESWRCAQEAHTQSRYLSYCAPSGRNTEDLSNSQSGVICKGISATRHLLQ